MSATDTTTWTWTEVGAVEKLNQRERDRLSDLLRTAIEANAGVTTSTFTAENDRLVFSATVALIGEMPVAFVMRDGHDVIVAVAAR